MRLVGWPSRETARQPPRHGLAVGRERREPTGVTATDPMHPARPGSRLCTSVAVDLPATPVTCFASTSPMAPNSAKTPTWRSFSSCPPAYESILGVLSCGTGGVAVVGDTCGPGGVADGPEGYVLLSHPRMPGLRGRVLLSSLLCAWAHSVRRGTPETCRRSDVRIQVICPMPAGS